MVKTYNGVNNSVDGPRKDVGAPSGPPIQNKGPGDHTRGSKPNASPKNTGAGYADGNTSKSNYVPKKNSY